MRQTPSFGYRLFVAVLILLVASCSGGGCSQGCSQCGTTPLPGGFPKDQTIPNAGAVRITRPGLNFVQDNLTTLATKALGTTTSSTTPGVAAFDIPKTSSSGADICSVDVPKPPQCQAEIGLGDAKLRIDAITPSSVKVDGILPIRIRDLPIKLFSLYSVYVIGGDHTKVSDLCDASLRGADAVPYIQVPVNIELPLVHETRSPRDGYTKLDVDNAKIDITISKDDIGLCDATCGSFCQGADDFVKDLAFDSLIGSVTGQVKSALSDAFCTKPVLTVDPPCPLGSTPDNADPTKAKYCKFGGTDTCVPSLLGLDGRMDLSAALAKFSPGATGGLDFDFASGGDMKPSPSNSTLPAWTPRNPPVPAEDNNPNGISLSMIGGATQHPDSSCVTIVKEDPPQDIALPKEFDGDTITPWPAGTEGPHLGFGIAGRFLNHAATSAYNSGALCLGISTETIGQLNSGFLSILAPSMKQLTFEENNAAAAIATHPGAPPKITLGGGTDVKTDPLLLIKLPSFGVDFYVFSLDRFVRVFTFTADISVPLVIQTGKDPATNPNGGLLPVLGDLKVENAKVSNADLLIEDEGTLAGSIQGLLGSVAGQFLGNGFSPIDLSSSLADFGLAVDIPVGGIRKISSSNDDFLAVFANLAKAAGAAHEQADTRAAIVAKEIDPSAMGLGSAVRVKFPKLKVHVTPVATRPTEQTWWVDRGTHAAWTAATDLVVDSDAMLLQGKHVLHVSSRIAGDMASEDATPVEIPFTVDTLAPNVTFDREGDRLMVKAYDYVSSKDALVVRRRIGGEGASWTEWASLGSAATFEATATDVVDVEVKDEEGNVGRVSQPLIRGRADSSLTAAGSGCGSCASSSSGGAGLAGDLALLAVVAAVVARRKRAIAS